MRAIAEQFRKDLGDTLSSSVYCSANIAEVELALGLLPELDIALFLFINEVLIPLTH